MEEKFTQAETAKLATERQRIKWAKEEIKKIEEARRKREAERIVRQKAEAEAERAERLRKASNPVKWARDNKIRAALLEMANTAKIYGMKFEAPGPDAGGRYNNRQPFTKLHVDNGYGGTEIVQIYIKHDGFEW